MQEWLQRVGVQSWEAMEVYRLLRLLPVVYHKQFETLRVSV